jgi:hypothetical protein
MLGVVGGGVGLTWFQGHDNLTLMLASLVSGLGLVVFWFYNRYDTENRRYQLPAGLLEGLAERLDPLAPIQLRIDFQDSLSFCSAERDETPPGWFQDSVGVRDFLHPWLELKMATVSGQLLTLKIERAGEIRETRKRRSKSTVTLYQDFASLRIEDPSCPESDSQSRFVPNSEVFLSLFSATTGRTVSIEAASQRQGDSFPSKFFQASDLTALFLHALDAG